MLIKPLIQVSGLVRNGLNKHNLEGIVMNFRNYKAEALLVLQGVVLVALGEAFFFALLLLC